MLIFIVNPNAGSEKGFKIWKKLERKLNKTKIEYKVYITDEPGDAIRIASEVTKDDYDNDRVIVAVGGDGTVNEVLSGLHLSDKVILGYIPTGSGNDLAKGLKLPRTTIGCLKRIIKPKSIRSIDYGVTSYGDDIINHRRFIVSSGIGYDAAVCHNLIHSKLKRILGAIGFRKLAYVLVGIGQLIKTKPTKGYIILDDSKKVEFNHILFMSAHIHPYEGGGFRFAPKADDTDGELTLCIIHNKSRKRLVNILISSYFGNHLKYPGVRTYNCKNVKVHMDRPLAVHVDGESCFSQEDIEISCIERKLRFIT